MRLPRKRSVRRFSVVIMCYSYAKTGIFYTILPLLSSQLWLFCKHAVYFGIMPDSGRLAKKKKGAIMSADRFPNPVQPLGIYGDCAVSSAFKILKWESMFMRTNEKKIKMICTCAATAALYAALTMLTAPISFGAVQFRVSEALCVLPFFVSQTAWGLFAGCLVSNIMSGNVFDIIFGSLATLLAAGCTAMIGRRGKSALLACLMPVLFNGVTWVKSI